MSYQVQHRLGRGGMGVVDLAVGADGRPVAIKRLVLHGSAHEMARARQRIHREAQALLALDHPNIVRLLEVIEDGHDLVLVMPYLAGGTLADQVRAHGPLSADQVRMLAPPLLSALAAAHRQGIVHRDIKPANVLFDADGRPYLADFGVASLRNATSGLTVTGMVVGTPEFMAPEQARGEPTTSASDVFSLGATLAFAATGNPPYGRGDPRVLVTLAAKGKVTPLPSTVPGDLRRRIEPLLDRQARRRPTAAAAINGPAGTRVLAAPTPRRRTWTSAALGATIGAIATIAVLAGITVAIARSAGGDGSAEAASVTIPTTVPAAPCEDQPYRPCGGESAPFTDGVECIADHGDYDADPVNGCEAAPSVVDPDALRNDQVLSANLVPGTNIDRYGFAVIDSFHWTCDGNVKVTLTAPKGASMHVEVLKGSVRDVPGGGEGGGRALGGATSSDGKAATVTLQEPNCLDGGLLGDDDATELVARVSWADDRRTAANYRLTVTGSY